MTYKLQIQTVKYSASDYKHTNKEIIHLQTFQITIYKYKSTYFNEKSLNSLYIMRLRRILRTRTQINISDINMKIQVLFFIEQVLIYVHI